MVDEQVDFVAEQLANVTELRGGFDAIGFSQGACRSSSSRMDASRDTSDHAHTGGQFLRAYIERYNAPPVNNLITFGSQHMGVSDLPPCGRWDVFCQLARRAAHGAVYTEWAQNNVVQVSTALSQ